MSFFGKWNLFLPAAALLLALAGCSPMDSSMDEEKEPHYVLGKSRVNAFNYTGAIEAFEESLEANPHSAHAHFQLAMLYENDQNSVADPAAAIYHYQEYLKYNPGADNADVVRQRIVGLKQKLAENVMPLPSTSAAQLQLEKLADENRRLHEQLAQWQAYYEAQKAAARTNPPAAQYYNSQPAAYSSPQPATSLTPDDVTTPSNSGGIAAAGTSTGTGNATRPAAGTSSGNAANPRRPADSHPARPHTHVVAGGETMASIARKCGVSLNALEIANPYVNPKKLKAGQVLNLPAQ